MILRRSCKQVSALLVAREDRSLSTVEQVALRFHLAACSACPVFERQILTMRNAMGRWRNYSDTPDDRP
ncbi:MAG: zf-HC2 domain-containing protein [Burkholderiales bacterium]|nr:zf-HC2 domain-containing protein [Burkholderiales bacterium]